MLVQISARVLTTSSPAKQLILSPRHYQHTDPDSGTQLVCDKCPAGTFVSVHCSLLAVRECSPCPEGTYTRGENGVQQCHRCQAPCPGGFTEKLPCTATQDRVCACPPNSFVSGDGGTECKPHSLCPPGSRAKKQGSKTEDVVCKPCTKGTFSDVKSNSMRCQAHTDCLAQGLVLLTPGTRYTDNVCGPPAAPSSISLTSRPTPTQAELVAEPMTSLSSLIGPAHKGESVNTVSPLLCSRCFDFEHLGSIHVTLNFKYYQYQNLGSEWKGETASLCLLYFVLPNGWSWHSEAGYWLSAGYILPGAERCNNITMRICEGARYIPAASPSTPEVANPR